MLSNAFCTSVIASNPVGGFKGTGLWTQSARSVDSLLIKESFTSSAVEEDFTERLNTITGTRSVTVLLHSASSNRGKDRTTTFKTLCDLFLKRFEQHCSNGTIKVNGTIRVST